LTQRSTTFYRTSFVILSLMSCTTLIKVFVDNHPLRYLFAVIFLIGLGIGYLRYVGKRKREEMQQRKKWLGYGLILLFAAVYMAIKHGIKTWLSYEVSSQDYGTVFAFFILGLFSTYYGLLSKNQDNPSK